MLLIMAIISYVSIFSKNKINRQLFLNTNVNNLSSIMGKKIGIIMCHIYFIYYRVKKICLKLILRTRNY